MTLVCAGCFGLALGLSRAEARAAELLPCGCCAAGGTRRPLSALTLLQLLFLFRAQVTGGIVSLSALTSQQMLLLFRTRLTGDISCLSALASLQVPFRFRAQVTGDISSLSALTILQMLLLLRT